MLRRWRGCLRDPQSSSPCQHLRNRIRAVVRIEPDEKLFDVVIDGVAAHVHRHTDLLIAAALREQQRDLALLRRKIKRAHRLGKFQDHRLLATDMNRRA